MRALFAAFIVLLAVVPTAAEDGPTLRPVLPATDWTWLKSDRVLFACGGGPEAGWKREQRTVCMALACDYKSPTLTLFTLKKAKSAAVLLRGYALVRVPTTNTEEERGFSQRFQMFARTLVLWGAEELGRYAVDGIMNGGLTVMVEGAKTDFSLPIDGAKLASFKSFAEDCGFNAPD